MAFPACLDFRQAVKEELYWHLKDVGDRVQTTRADPISAVFVFLHLLECYSELRGEDLLAYSQHEAAHPQPFADVGVDGTWMSGHAGVPRSGCHFCDICATMAIQKTPRGSGTIPIRGQSGQGTGEKYA